MIKFLLKLPIFKRLIPSLGIKYFKFFKKNRNFFRIKNIDFYLDFLDPIDRQIILNKEYEDDQLIFLEDKMRQNSFSYFFDVGANSGYYSFYLARKFKDIQVKAFEPNIDPYNKFKKTLEKNFFQNIEVFNFGLSDTDQKTQVRSMIKDGLVHSNTAVVYSGGEFDPKKFEIKEANFKIGDNIFNLKDTMLSIKIDVEGHEIYTLRGLINNLKNNKCLLLIEILGPNYDKVHNFLNMINYKKIFKSKIRSDYIYTNIKTFQIT
tara:strand:- start:51 stop:839 length:789 start_codon:yes stop_codon:yes gene_type:complete